MEEVKVEVKVTKTSEILRLWNEGKTRGEIAKELGIRYQHVYNTLVNKQVEMPVVDRSESKSSKIRAMFVEGKGKSEIAKELGITFQHVYNVLRSSNLISKK